MEIGVEWLILIFVTFCRLRMMVLCVWGGGEENGDWDQAERSKMKDMVLSCLVCVILLLMLGNKEEKGVVEDEGRVESAVVVMLKVLIGLAR